MSYPSFLPPLYNFLLTLTQRHGTQTLSRLDSKLFPYNRSIHISSDVVMDISFDPHLFGYLLQSHEMHIKNWIIANAPSSKSFVDIGANIGYFSGIAIAYLPPNASLLLIEPDPTNFQSSSWTEEASIKRNINLKRLNYAVSENSKKIFLNRHPEYCTYHTVNSHPQSDDDLIVESITLAEIAALTDTGEIECLKIDVEGHEEEVLRGGLNLFEQRKIKTSIIEISPKSAEMVFNVAGMGNYKKYVWNNNIWQEWVFPNDIYDRADVLLIR